MPALLDLSGDEPWQVSGAALFGAIPWLDRQRGHAASLFVRQTLLAGVRLYDEILPLVREAVAG